MVTIGCRLDKIFNLINFREQQAHRETTDREQPNKLLYRYWNFPFWVSKLFPCDALQSSSTQIMRKKGRYQQLHLSYMHSVLVNGGLKRIQADQINKIRLFMQWATACPFPEQHPKLSNEYQSVSEVQSLFEIFTVFFNLQVSHT